MPEQQGQMSDPLVWFDIYLASGHTINLVLRKSDGKAIAERIYSPAVRDVTFSNTTFTMKETTINDGSGRFIVLRGIVGIVEKETEV